MSNKKPFKKPARSAKALVILLKERGLTVPDEARAARYLNFIGYYHLMGYARVYQKQDNPAEHKFIDGVTFDDILNLYNFDRKLRILVIDALERVEVALRTVISNEMSLAHGTHWFQKKKNFIDKFKHRAFLSQVRERLKVKEHPNKQTLFVAHFYRNYNKPSLPPSWMVFEVLTFGTVSHLFEYLHKHDQVSIATHFKLPPEVLVSWMRALSALRNVCAHHEVLWNRKFTIKPKIAKQFTALITDNTKLHAQLVIARYLLNCISPDSSWARRLKHLIEIEGAHLKQAKVAVTIGFSENWYDLKFWGLPAKKKPAEAA